ncbi:MAG TPA: hypothetical protein VFR99_06235 [Marmoricola sp.]|nr:hypothetical protein [Marmoricola sp.]
MSATRQRCWLSWSSGKDSTMALAALREDPAVEVVGLLTTVNEDADRVAMHAVRRALLIAQAAALDLPLHVVPIPQACRNETYEERMAAAVEAARADGVTRMAFGDLFLADVRAYREQMLAPTGIEPLFPLWGRDTTALAGEMLDRGVRATLTCVDPRQLDAAFAGREYDDRLLAELPQGVDPCGENGEFHTFVRDGPGFRHPLAVRTGEVVERDGFVFADVLPE